MAHTSQVHQHFLSSSGCLVWVLGNRVVQSRWLMRSDWPEPALQLAEEVPVELSGHQDQLLLLYGQKEARIFTLQRTESSPGLVPQLYRNLFSSLESRLQMS
jgi:hypothetical protein